MRLDRASGPGISESFSDRPPLRGAGRGESGDTRGATGRGSWAPRSSRGQRGRGSAACGRRSLSTVGRRVGASSFSEAASVTVTGSASARVPGPSPPKPMSTVLFSQLCKDDRWWLLGHRRFSTSYSRTSPRAGQRARARGPPPGSHAHSAFAGLGAQFL